MLITLRVPSGAPVRVVALRTTPDGEGHYEMMTQARSDDRFDYWQAELTASMPVNPYRFELRVEDGLLYYNAVGVGRAQTPDASDFKLLADFQAPEWVQTAVFYQIFPDRFFNGDRSLDPADGAWELMGHKVTMRDWNDPPKSWQKSGSLDFYGGDLPGIQQKLDYLQELGVNAVYLNPIFTSKSNHRYNVDDFYNVDPHLGGNDALTALVSAMHDQDMRLILDLTPNHSSNTNPWFTAAQEDPNAPTAEYYTFIDHPDHYVSWLGVPTLPKLNYNSPALQAQMNDIVSYWLREPFDMDGWRMDVYNMTARQGALQRNKQAGQAMRQAIKTVNPDAYYLGEHFFDGTPNLQGDELDATMNYSGFNIPMWRWLAGYDNREWMGDLADDNLMPTDAFAWQLRVFRGSVPWVIARMQFNQLGSHDSWRILSIVNEDKALVRVGVGVLMTYPGVPCVYYGDEVGLTGKKDPDNRRCMPWDETAWDQDLRDYYQRLITLRKTHPALTDGGYQDLYAAGDWFAYQRESAEGRLVVIAYRGSGTDAPMAIPLQHAGHVDGTPLTDYLSATAFTVTEGAVAIPPQQGPRLFVLEG